MVGDKMSVGANLAEGLEQRVELGLKARAADVRHGDIDVARVDPPAVRVKREPLG